MPLFSGTFVNNDSTSKEANLYPSPKASSKIDFILLAVSEKS